MKTYKYIKDIWWYSGGCDCCEPLEMEYYQPLGFATNGTPSSEMGCYHSCIEIEDESLTDQEWDDIYELDYQDLVVLCRDKYGFVVEIVDYEEEH